MFVFLLSSGTCGYLFSPLLFHHCTGVLAGVIKQEKHIQGKCLGKEKEKLSLFSVISFLYLKKPIKFRGGQ